MAGIKLGLILAEAVHVGPLGGIGARLDDSRKIEKKKKKKKKKKAPAVSCEAALDPELLALPKGFHDSTHEVQQIPFAQVKAGASGVAFCKIDQAVFFAVEIKSINAQLLPLLTMSERRGSVEGESESVRTLEVPARYLGTRFRHAWFTTQHHCIRGNDARGNW